MGKEEERVLLDGLPGLVLVIGEGGCPVDCNRPFLAFFRYDTLEAFVEAEGMLNRRFLPEAGCMVPGVPLLEQLARNREQDRENMAKMRSGSGEEGYFLVEEAPLEGARRIVSFTDVTRLAKHLRTLDRTVRERTWDLMETDQALEKSLEQLEEAQRMAKVGHWELDVKTGVMSLSDEVKRIFGFPADWNPERDAAMAKIHPEDGEWMEEAFQSLEEKGISLDARYRIIPDPEHSEEIRYIRQKGEAVLDDQERPVRLYGMVQDRTDEVLAVRKEKARERLLAQQSKMAMMGEMIGAIAHQWKQPLNGLGLLVQDVREAMEFGELDQPYMDRFVSDAMRQVNFMSQTVDDFRSFFKPSKTKRAFDVRKEVVDIVHLLSGQMMKSRIDVELLGGEEEGWQVVGYPNELKQVALNLLNNGKDAILARRAREGVDGKEPEGKIRVAFCRKGDRLEIAFRDNGGGIPEAYLSKLFQPYFTSKGEAGTGIGLSMSKAMVEENMGGTLEAFNEEGGALFLLTFPLADESLDGR